MYSYHLGFNERIFIMKDILYCCTMIDRSEAPDASPDLLSALEFEFSSWTDEETKEVRHTLYFQEEKDSFAAMNLLKEKAGDFASFGCVFEQIACTRLKREDWAESWKLHFKPMIVSERLAISPSWEKIQTLPGQALIILDPGMSFGTGQHATTKFCLASIDRFIAELKGRGQSEITLLDAGSGSGILSIAARVLGCTRVDAFDIDPDTIAIARENAQKNGIADSELSLIAASLTEYPADIRYDIVAANILSSALIAGKEKLLSFCHPGTFLILAGILDTEYGRVKQAFESETCRELFSTQEKEWRGGAFLIGG